MKKSW